MSLRFCRTLHINSCHGYLHPNGVGFRRLYSNAVTEETDHTTTEKSKQSSTSSSERKPGFRVDLSAVKSYEGDEQDPEPSSNSQTKTKAKPKSVQWWKPDPISGVWVPDNQLGSINSAQMRQERMRNWPRASLDERAWWSSLEELPDDRRSTPSIRKIREKENLEKNSPSSK